MPTSETQRVLAYIVSDVHLNSHPFDAKTLDENPRRQHFRQFLSRLNESHDDTAEELLLILNGDIFDITGSWFDDPLPWDEDLRAVEAAFIQTLDRILENNVEIVHELTQLLQYNNVRICYILGNHDAMFNHFPKAKNHLLHHLSPDDKSRNQFLFMNSFESPELGLYVEHGHRFDPFNWPSSGHRFAFGDYVNLLMVNRFVGDVTRRMQQQTFPQTLIDDVQRQLHDLEYLRPMTLVPLWIETVANRYRLHEANKGKAESIDSILRSVLAEILDTNATRPLLTKLNLPRKFMYPLLNFMIHLPGTLPIVTLLISLFYRRTHSNKYQFRRAMRLHKHRGYRFVSFGHTHGPAVMPLGPEGYYFNTGSWKPVVNLFKHLAIDSTHLEALNPFVRFNKVEHAGILHIEKDLTVPDSVPTFSLQTTQGSGLSF